MASDVRFRERDVLIDGSEEMRREGEKLRAQVGRAIATDNAQREAKRLKERRDGSYDPPLFDRPTTDIVLVTTKSAAMFNLERDELMRLEQQYRAWFPSADVAENSGPFLAVLNDGAFEVQVARSNVPLMLRLDGRRFGSFLDLAAHEMGIAAADVRRAIGLGLRIIAAEPGRRDLAEKLRKRSVGEQR